MRGEVIGERLDDFAQIAGAWLQFDRAGGQLGQSLQIVEAGKHSCGVPGDGGSMGAVFVRCRTEKLLLYNLGKTLDRVDRRAHLVDQLAQAIGLARLAAFGC